jgi:hypothetical protein
VVDAATVLWEDADEQDYPLEDLDGRDQAAGPAAAPVPAERLQPGPAVHCLSLLVSQPQLLPQIQAELGGLGASPLDEDDFGSAVQRAICGALLAGAIQEDGTWPDAGFGEAEILAQLRAYDQRWPSLTRQQVLKDCVDSVLRLRIANLKERSRQLPALVREAEAEGQLEDAAAYRQLLRDLGQHRLMLEQALNARTHSGRRQALPSI